MTARYLRLITALSAIVAILCIVWAVHATRGDQDASSARARPSAAPTGPSAPIAVVTAPVRSERVTREINALGTARANEAVEITAKSANIVTAIRFTDGQRVARGQVLVELDSARARADLATAQATLTESRSQYDRARELVETQIVSRAQYEQLEAQTQANASRVAAARALLEDTVIRAPFAGRVGLRRISVGSLIEPGTVITTLDDTSLIKLDFTVPENTLAGLRTGLAITARAAAFPDREFTGKVTSIDSRIDPTTRAVMVRAVLPNPDGVLRPGMFLNVRLGAEERDALLIPEEALVPEQSRQFVYVVEEGKAVRREVRIGARRPGTVEVLAGLKPQERVVVEGTQKIRDGAAVRELAAVAQPQSGQEPA